MSKKRYWFDLGWSAALAYIATVMPDADRIDLQELSADAPAVREISGPTIIVPLHNSVQLEVTG